MPHHPQRLPGGHLQAAAIGLLLACSAGFASAMDSSGGDNGSTQGASSPMVSSSGDNAGSVSIDSSTAVSSSQDTDGTDLMDSSSSVFVLSSGGTGTSLGSSVVDSGGDEPTAPAQGGAASHGSRSAAAPASSPNLSTAGFGSSTAGFGSTAAGFGTSAAGHGSTPNGFGVAPQSLTGASDGHGTSPQGFGSSAQGFGGTPSSAGGGKYTDTSDIYGN